MLKIDEIFGQFVDGHLLRVDLGDDPAAIEHDKPVGDFVDMGEIVLNVDRGASGALDQAHEVDDLAHFGDAQRRRRLVEDDEVGVVVHRSADRDALPLAAGKIGDGRIDGDADAAETDHVDQDVLRELFLALDVDEAEAIGDLPADEEIAPQRLFVGERLVLVDRLDRQVVRHADRVFTLVDFSVANEDLAGRRRQDAGHHLDQGRLAGAVIADQSDDLIAAYGDIDVAQRVNRAKILLYADKAHDRSELLTSRRHRRSSPALSAVEHARVRYSGAPRRVRQLRRINR